MSNKQSSIEWLVSKILVQSETLLDEDGDLVDKPIKEYFNAYKDYVNLIEYVNKAKEMHKQEIMDAYIESGANIEDIIIEAAEQYYNQTFGK